jgi:diguanylate cyclase (GGDEF)-like protein/PAS domain S-box-containing protein
MAGHWSQLVANLAVVALIISIWLHGHSVVNQLPKLWRDAGFGAAMGIGAVISMMLGIQIDGALFDLRLSAVGIAGFFGGPVAAAVTLAFALGYRVLIVGGPAAWIGTLGIVLAAAYGVVVARIAPSRPVLASAVLATGVAAVTLGVSFAARLSLGAGVAPIAIPLSAMNGVATAMAAWFMLRHRDIERERDLLRAAFLQSPDVQYIKTPDSRFAAVNGELAKVSGFDDPAKLVGKSDHDILHSESADAILADDREIMTTGKPKLHFEELVYGPLGEEIWYRSSKVPLRNADMEIVAVAGWTRDITTRKRLELDLLDSRNRLSHVLTEMTDGVAMFDSQGTLAYCNERYASLFPRTGGERRRGQHYRDILWEVVRTGEQSGPKPGQEEEWIDKIAGELGTAGEEEVQLADGGWLKIRRSPTTDGSTLMVVSEVTKLKEAEAVLKTMTEQLKLLASTDGLTGLTNRRAFDQALETEMARCRRNGEPLSLLLSDVDKFKLYNDHYGHPAGDKVLKAVASCLAQSLSRPGDVAARYGGEEFVAILPGTDEDGAFYVANNFRETLRGMGMPHEATERGMVTASVGLATLAVGDMTLEPADLIRRADEALYNAKAAGRDRVIGWREHHDIKPVLSKRA